MTNKQPKYASLLDQFLDEVEPDYSSLGLKTPKAIGDQFRDLSADEADMAFLDDIAGHSRHTPCPSGRTSSYTPRQLNSKHEADNEGVLSEVTQTLAKAEGTTVEKKSLSDSEIQMRVKLLLNLGYTQDKIAGYLNKIALNVLDTSHGFGADFAKAYAEGAGLLYVEPNFFMKSCKASYEKIKKEGSFRALSVKKISACNGCAHNQCGSCTLYRKPIVASAKDVENVLRAELTKKNIKCASLKEGVSKLNANTRVNTPAITATANNGVARTAGDKGNITRKEASVAEIGAAVSSGVPIAKVFKVASATYGKVSAASAVKRYIAGLKESKAKIVLAALDCSFLKGKLASSNAIVGERKCASCAFRNGMHCGMTGGTLLSFPGMKNASTNKISHGNEVDGREMLFEYDILDTQEDVPLSINEDRTDTDVELTTTSKIDIE